MAIRRNARQWLLLVHVLCSLGVILVLTVAVIVFSTFGVGVWVEQSMHATAAPSLTASPVAAPLVVGAAANIVAFVLMTWASIVKPWGTTPWTARTRTSTSTTRPG